MSVLYLTLGQTEVEKLSHTGMGGTTDGEWTVTAGAKNSKFSNLITETFPQTSVCLHVDSTSNFNRLKVKRIPVRSLGKDGFSEKFLEKLLCWSVIYQRNSYKYPFMFY